MADWSKLPYDIIHMVATYIEAIEDFVAFSAVCHSWRLVYLTKQWRPGPQIPLLMFSNFENSSVRILISLYRNKVYNLKLPEARSKHCLGTSSVWLVTIGSDLQIHLLNAFTRVCARLPSNYSLQTDFDTIQPWYDIIDKALVIKKQCTSCDVKEDLLVMITYGPLKQLAFCRPGYRFWKKVKDTSPCGLVDIAYVPCGFVDIAYANHQLFALRGMGTLVTVDIDGPHPPKITHVATPPPQWAWKELFLVESSGGLWMVYLYETGNRRQFPMNAISFVIYSFDFSKGQWIQISNLGNRAIFLGDNRSMSICASDLVNCKCNSIYFFANKQKLWGTDREGYWNHLFVYNMTNRVTEPICFGPGLPNYHVRPHWVMPTLL